MSRLRILGSVLLGTVLTMSACSGACGATQSGPPPTVLALVLEVQDANIKLISATPSQGAVVAPSIAARVGALRHRDSLWFEYVLRGGSDLALARGAFVVSMSATVEHGPKDRGGAVRVPRRIVTVAVPYSASATSIAFSKAEPADGPPDTWQRVSLGASPLSARVSR